MVAKAEHISVGSISEDLPAAFAVRSAGHPHDAISFLSVDDAEARSAPPTFSTLAGWVRGYLMRPHPDLGRSGHVCPFTAQATRLALLRIGVSTDLPSDRTAILQTMQEALRAFDTLPCRRSTRIFRTVLVGFPQCTGPDGIEALHAVQNALRDESVLRGKMIGLFEPDSEAEGLINRHFRPLRAPVPTLAIRMLVEQDAPFVVRNPLLLPIYLLKFPFRGTMRLIRLARWPRGNSGLRLIRRWSRP